MKKSLAGFDFELIPPQQIKHSAGSTFRLPKTELFHQSDGGVTGVHAEGSRPCGEASYWAGSCTSVAVLLSYIGEAEEGAMTE